MVDYHAVAGAGRDGGLHVGRLMDVSASLTTKIKDSDKNQQGLYIVYVFLVCCYYPKCWLFNDSFVRSQHPSALIPLIYGALIQSLRARGF